MKIKKALFALIAFIIIIAVVGCNVPENTPVDVSIAPNATNSSEGGAQNGETALPQDTENPEVTPTGTAANITVTPIVTLSAQSDIEAFVTTDLAGKNYDQSLFLGSKLTMVNVWATWCQPCINELPELQRVSTDFVAKGVAVFGVLSDSAATGAVDSALAITASAGVTYPVLKCSETLHTSLILPNDADTALPTTLFINAAGDILRVEIGAKSYAEWVVIINTVLEGM